MAQLESILKLIQEEDVASSASASEALLKKVGGAINYIIQNSLDFVGKVETTMLTEAQFAATKGYDHTQPEPLKKWVLMKGQSIAGSKFAEITGKTTLPNAVSTGAFIGQASSDAQLLTYQESRNRLHGHTVGYYTDSGPYDPGNSGGFYSTSGHTRRTRREWDTGAYYLTPEGGLSAQPNTVRGNIFLKINE